MSKNSQNNRKKKKSVEKEKTRRQAAKINKQLTTTPTLYLDESGNTGANLLDDAQPIFTLASCNFSTPQATRLLKLLDCKSPLEAHFKNLRRRKSGQDGIVRILKHSLINPDNVKVSIFNKRYMITTKIVDILIEHMWYLEGKDLYKHGRNLALSNMLYHCLPTFCGEDATTEMYKSFVKMIREKHQENTDDFYDKVQSLKNACTDQNFKSEIDEIIRTKKIASDALSDIDRVALDPSIPAVFGQMVQWGTQHPKGFSVVHDNSKNIAEQEELLSLFMDWTRPQITLGYDRRKFELPLRAKSLEFSDSQAYPQLQVADIIASSLAYWAAKTISGETDDYLFQELEKLNLHNLYKNMIVWPTLNVTPETLGTTFTGGNNPADGGADFLYGAKKSVSKGVAP